MKISKKICVGMALFIVLVGLLLSGHNKAHAYSISQYWQECAYDVAFGGPGYQTICNLSSGSNGSNSFNYGDSTTSSLSNSAWPSVTYQTQYSQNPPTPINLLNSNNQPLVSSTKTAEALAWNTLTYTGQSYTTTTNNLKFYVYEPSAGAPNGSNFAFLASINSDGSLQVLALVYNVPNNNQVSAVSINKAAIASTSTGAPCANSNDPSCVNPNPSSTGTTGDDDSSCEASSGSALAWLMCPVFSFTSAIVQSTVNIFESLLSFTVAQDLGNQSNQDSVKTTWSIIKNIASIVLVIIMLIMVLSQAVSIGPFDAYTIRKLLPKLVAAVILMQLSWPLVSWIIGLFNDIGQGLQDLLFAPFGGGSTLNDLGKLINHAGIGVAGATAFNWVALLSAGVATLAALPTALFLAFAAVVGLLLAIITLIFRKILIILLLIFAPLALIAWVLPGTQRYWKLWSDNLIKVLAMYPLVVAVVAVGRIFAYVAGPQTTGIDGFASRLLALLFVLVGFIGPLFILPRTFRWGGGIMSAAAGAINNVGSRLNKSAEEPIKGWTRRQVQGRFAKRYAPEGAPGSTLRNRTLNSLLGGRIIPTKYRAAILTQSGDKWNEERDAEAQALLKRKGEIAMKEGYEAAVLTGDKTGFARWREDARGNRLDAKGNILYHKQANGTYKDTAGNDVNEMGDEVKERVDTYDQASKRTLTGVAAMKQMWVDLADESDNKHERKMAIRQLTATRSWPEVQGSLSRGGNKVIDTAAWADSITTSPEDYPRILQSRVDATPHIDNWAQRQLAEEKTKNPARLWTRQEEKDFISQKRVLYSIRDQMSNEDFQTQSEGYWEEVARVANLRDASGNLTSEAKDIQEALRQRFTAIHAIGGTGPQQLLGHLVGGSIQGLVDRALGPGANVQEYVATQTPLGGQTSVEAVSKRWETTIPTTVDLADPLTRAQYKNSLLTTISTRGGRTATSAVAQALAQGLAYDVVPPGSAARSEYMNVLAELKASAAPSVEATASYNALIDAVHQAYDRRAQEIVQAAIAEGRSPADVTSIQAAATGYANGQKAIFTKI